MKIDKNEHHKEKSHKIRPRNSADSAGGDLQRTHENSRAKFLKWGAGIAAIVGATAVLANQGDKKDTPETMSVQADSSNENKTIKYTRLTLEFPAGPNDLAGIQKWAKLVEQGLERFAASNDQIRTLLEFLRKNAEYEYFEAVRDKKEVDRGFKVVFVPSNLIKHMPSPVYYNPEQKRLRMAVGFKNQEWLSLLFAHELLHAFDTAGGLSAETKEGRAELEIRAYQLEIELLKSMSPEIYKQLIEKGTPIYRNRYSEKDKTLAELDKLISHLYSLQPGNVTHLEKQMVVALCCLAIAFADTKSNLSPEKRYLDYTKVFLGREGF